MDRNGNLWAWWATRTAAARRRRHRLAPRLGARRRRLRRPARRRVARSPRSTRCARRGVAPATPVAVANFADEEGARFGVACAGSRLITGALDRRRGPARCATRDGVTLAEAMARAGRDPDASAATPSALRRHRRVRRAARRAGPGAGRPRPPVGGRPRAIWPHGRWRFDFAGEANHAGTTRLADRRDPMLTLRAHRAGRAQGGRGWHGARGHLRQGRRSSPTAPTRSPRGRGLARRPRRRRGDRCDALVDRDRAAADERADRDGDDLDVARESLTADRRVRPRPARPVWRALAAPARRRPADRRRARRRHPAPAGVPTAMLFVRNPTGVSHSPGRVRRRRRLPGRRRGARRRAAELAGDSPTQPTLTYWLRARAWLGRRPSDRADVLIEVGRRPDHRRDARRRRAPAADADRLPGLTLPGLANAHSHAFHRALRGRTQAGRRHVLDLARARCTRSPTGSTPDTYLDAGPRGLRRDGAGRHHRGRRVPLPAPRAGRRAVRRPERDGRRR